MRVKTLTSGYFAFTDRAFMFTTGLTEDILLDTDGWLAQPLIVQQRLKRAFDVRVIVVADFVVAAAVTTDGDDWRLHNPAPWRRYPLPEAVAHRCSRLVRELGLRYAAIDLVDDGQQLWFLEANQAGEFQFLDRPLDLGIADALAEQLAGKAT